MLAPGTVVDGMTTELGPVPALGAHTAEILDEFGEARAAE
jgi:crotonobetainyl-CoA:carnitine CoA-transferase CaiB-like acyl-CoA transferase